MEEKTLPIRFNEILREEMGKVFEAEAVAPLDPDFTLKYPSEEDKSVCLKREAAGLRQDLRHPHRRHGFCRLHAGALRHVQPGKDYDFPVFGYTFAYSSKFLIAVLDLHPVAKDREYTEKYIAPLQAISQKYAWIPKTEGGRSEVHDWAKKYDSGCALYRWCDPQYVPNVEEAFRDYLRAFCQCIKKAEPLTDPLLRRPVSGGLSL